MSEAAIAVPNQPEAKQAAPDTGQKRVTELRVTGHLMTLETGVFCVYQAPGTGLGHDETGLPGVRISLPPGLAGNPEAVSISTFRPDGWLSGRDAAALVRVSQGPAQVLVTVYQSPSQGPDGAPRLQVLRLGPDAGAPAAARSNGAGADAAPIDPPYVVAHVQRTGDVGAKIGDWLGLRGSKLWIEGFAIVPPEGIPSEDIEYQAVLGRGWNSPWMEGGKFCGSRGMALPLLGIRARLKGGRRQDAPAALCRHLRRRHRGRPGGGRRGLRSRQSCRPRIVAGAARTARGRAPAARSGRRQAGGGRAARRAQTREAGARPAGRAARPLSHRVDWSGASRKPA